VIALANWIVGRRAHYSLTTTPWDQQCSLAVAEHFISQDGAAAETYQTKALYPLAMRHDNFAGFATPEIGTLRLSPKR
jgi:hypothetical protein